MLVPGVLLQEAFERAFPGPAFAHGVFESDVVRLLFDWLEGHGWGLSGSASRAILPLRTFRTASGFVPRDLRKYIDVMVRSHAHETFDAQKGRCYPAASRRAPGEC